MTTAAFETTEIGPVPPGWRVRRFDELFAIQQGKQVSRRTRDGDMVRPFLRTKNVHWGAFDLAELDSMHFTAAEQERLALRQGDLLICEGGEIGRTALWQGEAVDCYYQNHLHRARVREPDEIDPEFALYWLWYAFKVERVYFGRANVTTIPNLSKSRLGALPLLVPDNLAEQVALTAVLRQVLQQIRTHERKIELLHELHDSALATVTTNGLRDEPLVDSTVGPVPESWTVAPLGNYLQSAQYGLSGKGGSSGTYPLLRMTNQQDGRIAEDDLQYVDLPTSEFEKYRLDKGDVLFNRTNSHELVGRTSLFDLDGDFVFASYLLRLKLQSMALRPAFLTHYMEARSTQARLRSIAQRAVSQSNISASRLSTFEIPVPSPDEQDDIVRLLDAVDGPLEQHRRAVTAMTDLFHTMLHQFMTGQVRLDSGSTGEAA